MTTMTIHADDALAEAIRKGAADAGQSISKFIQTTMGTALGLFKRIDKDRKLPSFLQIKTPLTDEGYRELMSVQKDFEVIDEEMWK